MADSLGQSLVREAASTFAAEGNGARAVAEAGLGIAKLRIHAKHPDAWFVTALGVAPPSPLEEIEIAPVSCSWLAPGEWLVTGPEAAVELIRRRCADIVGPIGLMTDLTHARAIFEVSGHAARSVLSAHCPLDLGSYATPVGAARRSIFSETTVFISRRPDRDGEPAFRLIFDQAMAGYAERMLGATISGATA